MSFYPRGIAPKIKTGNSNILVREFALLGILRRNSLPLPRQATQQGHKSGRLEPAASANRKASKLLAFLLQVWLTRYDLTSPGGGSHE